MIKKNIVTLFLVGLFLAPLSVMADDKGLDDPRGSLITESHGKITVLRSQPQGMEYGSGKNRLDAEVIFKLNEEPGKTFGIRLHEGVDPSMIYMTELLRDAFIHNFRVTVLHQNIEGVINNPVTWVEISRSKK